MDIDMSSCYRWTVLGLDFVCFLSVYNKVSLFLLRLVITLPRLRSRLLQSACLSVCVCCVCLSVCEHISETAGRIFTNFCADPCGRGSVLLWRHCDMLCASGLMDGVTFGPHGAESDVYECLVLCFVYFLFVVVWLSVPVQLIVWKDSPLKWPFMCRVGRQTIHTQSLTYRNTANNVTGYTE